MGKKSSLLPVLKCDLCNFATKNAYIYKRHRIRCKRERYTEAHTFKPKPEKVKLSGASLFASASSSKLQKQYAASDDRVGVGVDNTEKSTETLQDTDDDQEDQEPLASPESFPETFRKGNVYCRTYRCPECEFFTNKSKTFLYHQINAHKRNLSIFTCNFCEYSCKHRHKVQRHLKLVHRYNVDIDDVMVEYQSEKPPTEYKTKSPKPPVESPVKNISPLKVKIALTTPASRQAARGKDVLPAGFENHMVELTSEGKKLFKCKYCLFNNGDKYRVSKHVQSIHINARTYKCSVCSFTTVNKKDYYTHKAEHSDKVELFQCEDCDYTSDFKPNLDRHRLNHINQYSIKCKFCSYSCDHEGTVKRHMANNHMNSAENVSLIFPDTDTAVESTIGVTPPQGLAPVTDSANHAAEKDSSPDVSINIADSSATERVPSLQTVEGTFFCPICGLRYKRSSDLNRHMKLKHKMTVKAYLRNYNSYLNSSAGASEEEDDQTARDAPLDLSVGKELDEIFDKDNLKCSYCSYLAKWPSDLRRHMVIHTCIVEKRYKCPHCSKQYKYVGDLNVHLRRDHKKEPGSVKHVKVPTIPNRKSSPAMFKCPSCSYTSQWKSEVDRHSKTHKGEDKPFCCNHCPYQTHWKGDIRRHMYKHHPSIMADGVVLDNVITILTDKLPGNSRDRENNSSEPLDDDMDEESISSHDTDQVFGGDDSDSENSPLKDSPSSQFNCRYCSFTTNAPSKLKAHESTHTNLKEYMCPVCGRRANWKWDIRKHIKKDHPNSPMDVVRLSRQEAEATIQTYLDTNPVVRREHHLNVPTNNEDGEEAATQGNSFVCSACDFSSNSRAAVSRHIRNSHNGLNVDIICLVEEEVDDEVQIKIPRTNVASSVHAPKESTPVSTPTGQEDFEQFSFSEQPDKPYMCAECGKTGNIKADVRKHYHYRHPNQPIKIWYSDETGTKMLPVEPCMSRTGTKRKLSSSSTSSLVDHHKSAVYKEANDSMDTTPEKNVPGGPPNTKASPASLIKPFMCAECGKRGATKADIKKHFNYIHPGSEVKVFYQENNNSPYEKFKNVNSNQTTLSSPPKAIHVPPIKGPSPAKQASPGKGSAPLLSSADPKVFGYCKPFQCSECGRRSNWKWDLNKHIRLKHPGSTTAHMIALSEEEARATHDTYIAQFNQTTHVSSAYKKAVLARVEKQAVSLQNVPSKGVHKQFKCSGCPYRSNWRSDIIRHTKRKHGGRSRLVVMDTEEAKVSLMEYNYNPRKKRDCEMTDMPKSKYEKSMSNLWKCGRCTFRNRDRTVVVNHLSMHNIKAYKCSICSYATNYRSSAYRHIRVRHQSENLSICRAAIKCVKAGKDGQLQQMTDENEKEDYDWKDAEPDNFYDMFKCKLCGFHSSWRSCVTRHIREKHKGSGKGKVMRVRKYFKDEKKVNKDVDMQNRRYKCDVCPYRTAKSNLLQFHMSCHKAQPGIQQVKCPYCPYFVVAQRLLRQHIKLHERNVYQESKNSTSDLSTPTTPVKNVVMQPPSTPKRHQCEKCPYNSNSKNDYLYHKQFHKPKENAEYKCHICDYWVTHKRLLKQHLKVHEVYHHSPAAKSTNGSAQSSPCKSDFSESSSIYDMVQLATYKQKVIASKIMPSISQKPLMSPMKIACSVGNKPGYVFRNGIYKKLLKCKKCPYMNVRLRNLKLHEMMHGIRISRNPLLKCPHCDYYVGSKGLLSHHLKVHQPSYMTDVSDTSLADYDAVEGAIADEEMDDKSDIVDISYESKVDTLYEIARFKKYSCEKCPYASAKRSHYEHHVELHGSKQRCGCRYCDYSVPSQNLLAQHEKLHRTPNQNLMVAQSLSNLLQLPEVPADVALASALPPLDTKEAFTVNVTHDHLELFENSAEAENEPKKLYRCDRCPYANVRRDHLLSHLKFHMIKSDLACPYCDYTAAKQHLLTQHIKVHFSPLPELSNWLAQNGQVERMQQSKEPDITEALYVAQLLQGESKKEDKKDSTVVTEVTNSDQGVKVEGEVDEKDGEKNNSSYMDEAVPSSSSDCKMSTTEPVALIPTLQNGRDAVVENSKENDREIGEQNGKEGDIKIKEEVMSNDEEDYICQYCDREFPASDQLVMHEMQHLIGNNFKDFLVESQVKTVEPETKLENGTTGGGEENGVTEGGEVTGGGEVTERMEDEQKEEGPDQNEVNLKCNGEEGLKCNGEDVLKDIEEQSVSCNGDKCDTEAEELKSGGGDELTGKESGGDQSSESRNEVKDMNGDRQEEEMDTNE